jgi:hypothetical protein
MTYRQARCKFTEALGCLVIKAKTLGYEVAFAEGMDRVTEKDPTTDHMKGSLHELGLAQDIDLYLNGEYLRDTIDHQILGEYWEQLGKEWGVPLTWGGRFNDGNHYSLAWNGRK